MRGGMEFFGGDGFDEIFGMSDGIAGGGGAEEAARLRRAQRNREAAHRSRAKHKVHQQNLEGQAERALELHTQLRMVLDRLMEEIAPAEDSSPNAATDIFDTALMPSASRETTCTTTTTSTTTRTATSVEAGEFGSAFFHADDLFDTETDKGLRH